MMSAKEMNEKLIDTMRKNNGMIIDNHTVIFSHCIDKFLIHFFCVHHNRPLSTHMGFLNLFYSYGS